MEQTCPRCSKALPDVETLKFRFCPHCGAEIAPEPRQIEDAYLTIPPDPPLPPADHRPMDFRPESEIKEPAVDRFNDQTGEPQSESDRQPLELKPPTSPPPAGFFRTRSAEKPPLNRPAEKVPPKRDIKKQPPAANRKIVIGVLVILVIIILALGALFTF
jgi:hypothetical protein